MIARRWVLGLGSNLGSREALIRAAIELLAEQPGIALKAHSRVWETAPVGPPQPNYLNAAVLVESALAPDQLWSITTRIETSLGRARRERWGARTIDIDILWAADTLIIATPALQVPHAELLRRRFALAPLLDLVPDARDPRTGEPLSEALRALAEETKQDVRPLGFGFADPIAQDASAFEVHGWDRADVMVRAIEAITICTPSGASVRAMEAVQVEADDDRLSTWSHALRDSKNLRQFAVRRVVMFGAEGPRSRGAVIGTTGPSHDAPGAPLERPWSERFELRNSECVGFFSRTEPERT